MSIFRRAYEAIRTIKGDKRPKPKRPEPKTIAHLVHHMWGMRSESSDYDYDEKRLWMVLQRFVERKGGLQASIEDFRS
jgi:hypothetical protein